MWAKRAMSGKNRKHENCNKRSYCLRLVFSFFKNKKIENGWDDRV